LNTKVQQTEYTSLSLAETSRPSAGGPSILLFSGHRIQFSGGKIGRGMILTTHLYLVPILRMSGVTPLFPLYAKERIETTILFFYFFKLVPRSKIFCTDVRDQPVLQRAYVAAWLSAVYILFRFQRH